MKHVLTLVLIASFTAGATVLAKPAGAVTPPGNTHLGTQALSHNTGGNNTAVGYKAMDPNAVCTGSGTPHACCTGAGSGSCGNRGYQNAAVGAAALQSNSTGSENTAVGNAALTSNTGNDTCTGSDAPFLCCQGSGTGFCGSFNSAVGAGALSSNTAGWENTAVGQAALYLNTAGNGNTAVGSGALLSNTTAFNNTGVGDRALQNNSTGSSNTAVGASALSNSTTASGNTAVGDAVLNQNTTGDGNTGVGDAALDRNTTGTGNTAVGDNTLFYNTTGTVNTAVGAVALYLNTTGTENTAIGTSALEFTTTGQSNTALGNQALVANTTGNNNIALGKQAGSNLTTGNNNIDIGNAGVAAEANTIHIGTSGTQAATFIAGIRGVTTGMANGVTVLIDSNGQLGTISSSRRFKTNIRDMGTVSSKLMQLRPVTFQYKPEVDPSSTTQYGLIAEEVAAVFPDLVARDKDGKIETVKYHLLAALLLNEVQKQAHTQETLVTKLEQQQRALEPLLQSIDALQRQNADEQLRNAVLQERLDRIERSVQAAAGQRAAVASATGGDTTN